jgi:alginate O-acetyltransferase complex protein AlgJ
VGVIRRGKSHGLSPKRRGRGGEHARAVVGRDGWLFLENDSNRYMEQYTGKVRPPLGWARRYRRLLTARRERMAKLALPYLFAISPPKEPIYPEMLPDRHVAAERRTVHELLEIAAEAGITAVYPEEALRAAKPQGPVYYQADTHWTPLGAFVAYREICAQLERWGFELELVEDADIDWQPHMGDGDLGRKLDPPVHGLSLFGDVRDPHGKLLSDNGLMGTGAIQIFESDRRDAPRLLCFGTSYAGNTMEYFKESFSRVVWAHTNSLIDELIAAERPDVVLSHCSERGLLHIPSDRNAMRRFEATAREKLAASAGDSPG